MAWGLLLLLVLLLLPAGAAAQTEIFAGPTPLQSITGVINVLNQGAKCDGVTDDKAALQAALTAVPTGGGAVYIPANRTCLSSVTLLPKAETMIFGAGRTTSKLKFTSTTAGAIFINAQNANRLYLRDLQIIVNGNSQIGVEAMDVDEPTIVSVKFISSVLGQGTGLRVRASGPSGSFSGNVYATEFENLAIGCQLGVAGDGAGANVWNFYGIKMTSNGTGCFIEQATNVNFWGGRAENNTAVGIDSSTAGGTVCVNVGIHGMYFELNPTSHYRVQAACVQWYLDNLTTVGGTFVDNGQLTLYSGNVQGTPAGYELLSGAGIRFAFTQAGVGIFLTFRGLGFTFATIAATLTADGMFGYCQDCTIANPCAGGGSGAIAKRLNGQFVCN